MAKKINKLEKDAIKDAKKIVDDLKKEVEKGDELKENGDGYLPCP